MENLFACMHAVVHFALVENLLMESRFEANIIVLVRFIDDAFMIRRKIKILPYDWRDFKHALIKNRI